MVLTRCVLLAVILWKCRCLTATRSIMENSINVCENVSDHLFIQDIDDCAKYFVCVNGYAKSQQCGYGLYFDATRQACIGSRQSCLQCPAGRMINLPLVKTCDKYISCYYGQVMLRKCGINQQFNIKTGKCDWAKNIDCVDNRCSIYSTERDSIYVPSAASCENYYICQAGKAKLLTCDNGLYFNTKCNCCDKAENVQCLAKDFETPMENSKQSRYNNDYSNLKQTPTLIGETNKIKCPSKGYFIYEYIEDPEYYFTCVNGKASLYACPSDLQFNDKLKRCVSKRKETEIEIDSDIFKAPLTKEISSQAEMLDEFADIVCPKFATFTLPHVDKQKFYLCLNGKSSILMCAKGQIFNNLEHSCTQELMTEEIESNIDLADIVNSEHELFAAPANNICPLAGNTTLPHAQKNQYYLCIEGKVAVFSCAPDLYYDVNLKSCTTNTSSISNNEIYNAVLDTDSSTIICPRFGTFKHVHLDRNKFYLCIDGKKYILSCASNEIFDASINTCRQNNEFLGTYNVTVETISESSIECPTSGNFTYSHTEKNLYYICLEGNSTVMTCPEGLIFDADKKTCKAPDQSKEIDSQLPQLVEEFTKVTLNTEEENN